MSLRQAGLGYIMTELLVGMAKLLGALCGYMAFKHPDNFWLIVQIYSATILLRLLQLAQAACFPLADASPAETSQAFFYFSALVLFTVMAAAESSYPVYTQAVITSCLSSYIFISSVSFILVNLNYTLYSPLDGLNIWNPLFLASAWEVRGLTLGLLGAWALMSGLGVYTQILRHSQGLSKGFKPVLATM